MWHCHDVLLKSSCHLKQKRKVIIWAFLRLLLFSLWECLLGCLAPVDSCSHKHRVFCKARPVWCGEGTWITAIFCNTQWCLQLCEEKKKEVDISDSPLIHLRSHFKREKNKKIKYSVQCAEYSKIRCVFERHRPCIGLGQSLISNVCNCLEQLYSAAWHQVAKSAFKIKKNFF